MPIPLPPPPCARGRRSALTSALTLLLCLGVLLGSGAALAQTTTPSAECNPAVAPTEDAEPCVRYWRDQYGSFALTGNTLAQDCRQTTPRPLIGNMPPIWMWDSNAAERGCYAGHSAPNFFWTLDDATVESPTARTKPTYNFDGTNDPATGFDPLKARSQSVLALPTGAKVTYARLYWSASRFNGAAGDQKAEPDLTVTLARPGLAGFSKNLTALPNDWSFERLSSGTYQYQSSVDITDLVKGYGAGAYQVSDVQIFPMDRSQSQYVFASWWMVVFYELNGAPKRHLKLFDSMKVVRGASSTTVGLNGFYVPPYAVDAKLGVIAFEGEEPDPDTDDSLEFNGLTVSNDMNPTNNFFNSSRSWTKQKVSPGNYTTIVDTDTPLTGLDAGTDGVLDSLPISNDEDRPQLSGVARSMSGLDLDVVDVTVAPGNTSARVTAISRTGGGDHFWLGGFVTAITTQAPDFTDTVKEVRRVFKPDGSLRTDGSARLNDTLEYVITVVNKGDDDSKGTVLIDRLPPQLDYVPGFAEVLTVVASDDARNVGVKTDAAGDDVAEYDLATRTLTMRLGTGATATQGGSVKGVLKPGDVAETTSIAFRAKIVSTLQGRVENQGIIRAGGMLGIDPVETKSRPKTGASGPTRISVVPTPVIQSPADGSTIKETNPTYSGLADPDSTVTVRREDGTVVCTATAVATTDPITGAVTGRWSCTGTPLTPGPHTITAEAQDSQGNVSIPATSTFTVDTLDSDGDGIPDSAEDRNGTNKFDDDTDDDGILDGNEDKNRNGVVDPDETDPTKQDTDGDGLQDGTELGLTTAQGSGTGPTFQPDVDPTTKTDPRKTDTDNGGVSDGVEDTNKNGRVDTGERNPLNPADDNTVVDTDGDGIPDSVETATGTDPTKADTDGDGIPDGVEDKDRDGVVDPDETDPRKTDSDGDGIPDGTEDKDRDGVVDPDETDPRKTDSDNDGLPDGTEDADRDGVVDAGETDPRDADSDNDGISDGIEADSGTNPLDDDSDDDGLLDGTEDADRDGVVDAGETNPRNADTDGDGLQDGTEKGLSSPQGLGTDLTVFQPDADTSTQTDPLKTDTDNGGVSDGVEDTNKNGRVDAGERNPLNPADDNTVVDTDGDGIPDSVETATGTDPTKADTDGDGIPDGVEDKDRDGVVDPGETDPRKTDSDNDGLPDGTEDADRDGVVDPGETDPRDADSDNDGISDGIEAGSNTNPLDDDTDNDGLLDGTEDADRDGIVDAGETNPRNADTDGDGLQDGTEKGLSSPQGLGTDLTVFQPDADPGTQTDPLKTDTDNGGVSDGVEDTNKNGRVDAGERNPLNPADDTPVVDTDGDGVPDNREKELGLDPDDADSDDDGVPDGQDGLTDTDGDGTIDAKDADSDNDGIKDGTELGVTRANAPAGTNQNSPDFVPDDDPSTTTNPKQADTDNDGLKDGDEDKNHDGRFGSGETNPNDADTDDGGLSDGDEVKGNSNPLDDQDDFLVLGRGCSSSGGSPLVWLAAVMLGLPLMRSRRSSRRGSVVAGGLLGVLGVLAAPAADAQAPASSPVSQSIDVQRYKPGPGATDILGVHGAKVDGHLGWHLGASVNYANNPLNFFDPRQDDFVYGLVAHQMTLDLMGSISLWDRVELGVALPVTYQASESDAAITPAFAEGVSGAGAGDLRLVPKARLLTAGGFDLGLVVPVLLPSAGGQGFRGGSSVSARPQLVGEWGNGNGLRVVANVGANLQKEEQLRNLRTGNELMLAVGAQVPLSEKLALRANIAGAFGLNEKDTEGRPLEVLAAVQYRLSKGLAAHVGGGPGLTRGYGTPGFRVFAGLDWTQPGERAPAAPPPPADTDGDGIVDGQDTCPQVAEDKDGFQDTDGCPDENNDGDTLTDAQDKCPAQAETVNGFQDEDGCPDEKPAVDTDKDGLMDDQDKCPAQPEDKDGFQDEDGCADTDNDKDGVPDWEDQCPVQPEVINGVKDEDGCPDEGKSKVRLESSRILILDKVYFATSKDVILPKSFDLLKQVASVLKANPQIELLRVEGHTDNQGKDAANLNLSQRRASNVRSFLIKEGIAPERLEAVGYGETKPVDNNKTAAGRENNRRVEFNILKMAGEQGGKTP